jgi:hypothetical protein
VSVVRIHFDDLDLRSFDAEQVSGPTTQRVVADAREAAAVAGFVPGIPSADVIAGTPGVSVISATAFRFVLNRRELTSALSGAGAAELEVPGSWEGASFSVQVGPIVEVDYPDADVSLLESRPFTVDNTPPAVTMKLDTIENRRVRVAIDAADQTSTLNQAEVAIDTGDWRPVFPKDGIIDSKSESFSFLSGELASGEHVIAFRVYDQNDNAGMGKLVVRVP